MVIGGSVFCFSAKATVVLLFSVSGDGGGVHTWSCFLVLFLCSVHCYAGTLGVVFGGLYGYVCGCFQAWFRWLCSSVAPVTLNLGGSGGGVVDLALPVCG
jgi:hypothetical protein